MSFFQTPSPACLLTHYMGAPSEGFTIIAKAVRSKKQSTEKSSEQSEQFTTTSIVEPDEFWKTILVSYRTVFFEHFPFAGSPELSSAGILLSSVENAILLD